VRINLDIAPEAFQSALNQRITGANGQLPWLAERVVADLLIAGLEPLVASGHLVATRAVPYGRYAPTSLAQASEEGICLWYLKLELDAPKGRAMAQDDFQLPSNLVLQPIRYADGERTVKFNRKSMKTRERHQIELLKPSLPAHLFTPVAERHRCGASCNPSLLDPVIKGVWDWRLRFTCRVCGRAYYCSCFERALQVAPASAKVRRNRGGAEVVEFLPKLCHLCTDKPSNLEFCHPMYGSSVLVRYGPYVRRLEYEEGLSSRDAENRVREILGIARIGEGWISETQLYRLVVYLFSDHAVIREASPEWLGRQRLDIYIAELGLAIEYQGQQHYKSVGLFGGDEALARTKERDRRKRDLCEANGVTLIYFRHDEALTEKVVTGKLKRFLKETSSRTAPAR
jgi:hypothetical protein